MESIETRKAQATFDYFQIRTSAKVDLVHLQTGTVLSILRPVCTWVENPLTPSQFQAQIRGMLEGLKIGECLELTSSTRHLMDSIASFGNVKIFVVDYDPQQPQPRWPFLLGLQDLNHSSQWRHWFESPLCKGLLIRLTDQSEVPDLTDFQQKALYFDYQITNVDSTIRKLNINETQSSCQNFFHLDLKKSSKLLHQVLQARPQISKPRLLDLPSPEFADWADLENFQDPVFQQNQLGSPQFSVIIPHFNSPHFVTNALRHLNFCKPLNIDFEVLLVDDHSRLSDFQYIQSFIQQHLPQLPIRLFRWPEQKFLKSGSRLFRAGASRNWGAQFARGEFLFFLDSDMLVPTDFFTQLEQSLENSDVVQFKRLHIPVNQSSEASRYQDLIQTKNLFVEEARYWNQLFESEHWDQLNDHWKFCCTYGLGLRKNLFQSVGRIRRNFIQYGFEDTDLGYRLHRAGACMSLNKTPLLHLSTQQDHSQTRWYQAEKLKRLRPMAKTFYGLNMDPHLYPRFRTLVD